MTFSDLVKEIIDSSKERVKTPISGAYVLSFMLWNWRPIALLLFEKTTITQKIIVINSEYSNFMAVFGPLLLGLFFTVGIPYLMVIIDIILEPAKKNRLKTIYRAKNNELSEQIELVEKELRLQDKRTRSKSTEDFENEIKELQTRLETANVSNKVTVEGYDSQIKSLNATIKQLNESRDHDYDAYIKQAETNEFVSLMLDSDFQPNDFIPFKNIALDTATIFDKSLINSKVRSFLAKQNFTETINTNFRFTPKGIRFMRYVKDILKNDEKSQNSFLHPDID